MYSYNEIEGYDVHVQVVQKIFTVFCDVTMQGLLKGCCFVFEPKLIFVCGVCPTVSKLCFFLTSVFLRAVCSMCYGRLVLCCRLGGNGEY